MKRMKEQFADQAFDMLSAILDQSRECIKLLSRDGEFVYVNDAGRRIIGIGDTDTLNLSQWLARWPQDSREPITAVVERAQGGKSGRFEGYCPPLDGSPRWMELEVTPIHDDTGRQSHVLIISRDVTEAVNQRQSEQHRREAAEREAFLSDSVAREMRHRFKNQLAVISSLLRLSARNATDTADLATRFEQRLAALARAQDFLTIHHGDRMSAATAIEQILRASGAGERVEVAELPDVALADDSVQYLALILGELQTNALKYGALASPKGRITLSAEVEGDRLALRWRETGSAPVVAPTGQGGGLKLLERMGSRPGARATVDWQDTGMTVTFYVRLAQ